MQGSRLLKLWFGLDGSVTQRAYLLSGIGLAVVKYGVEAGLVAVFTPRWLSPAESISPSIEVRAKTLAGAPEWLGWALFLWSIPFLWIAISMSVRRAAAPPWRPSGSRRA